MTKSRLIALLAVTFVAGLLMRGGLSRPHAVPELASESGRVETWTCSMHPQIRQPGPGKCPLCGMDLIPAASTDNRPSAGPRELALSPAAQALAEVATAPVERRFVETEIRLVGKIAYDETRVRDVSVLTEGVIERLFVNYTGVPVKKGEHLAEIYSPEVLAASKELLVARAAGSGSAGIEASRRKLTLLGVSDEEIEAILKSGEAKKTFTLFSPIDGVVTSLGGHQGHWLMKGDDLAEITDISTVWALLDAYEADLPFIRYGHEVRFTADALPGRTFTGHVSFIPPALDDMTRTVKVRLNVPNADGALRPGLFVRATVKAQMTADGFVVHPEMKGKWVSPMHPEIVKDEPGPCDICGMPLVRAEDLGLVPDGQAAPPLVMPASAPLVTGRRAIVYVALPDKDGVYEGREVRLGPRAGDHYIVLSGVREGELVVTRGAMKIDSTLQIQGKQSMMTPAEPARDVATQEKIPDEQRRLIHEAMRLYFEIQGALAGDDFPRATEAAAVLSQRFAGVETEDLRALADDAAPIGHASDIAAARQAFEPLSEHMIRLARESSNQSHEPVYVAFCPMAFDNRGASWLQEEKKILNPYFGSKMLRCGTLRETLGASRAP